MRKNGSKASLAALKLEGSELLKRRRELGSSWRLVAGRRLERDYEFKDFKRALAFTNKVGALAEKLGHHPDIALAWGKVGLAIWTHSAGGLTEADFTLASKISKLKKRR